VSSLIAPSSTAKPSVMIVEDETLIAFSLEDDFRDQGFEVSGSFTSCAEALAAFGRHRPDIAVIDATLSDGSCIELARELLRRSVPFIVYSGRNARDEQAPELEGVPWIEKPAPSASVVQAASRLLARVPA
jgi:DNA-binding response OmpR family regulator